VADAVPLFWRFMIGRSALILVLANQRTDMPLIGRTNVPMFVP
jgi:hypothetical protein